MIKKCEDAGLKHLSNSTAFIEHSNTMDDVYENIDDYSPNRRRKILIVFDDMIADIYYMQKTKYFTCVYHSVLFLCSKRHEIEFNMLFDYEN